jgi:hypothetical protein
VNTRKPEIVIRTNGLKPEITIDGKKLEGVIGYKFSQDWREGGGVPRLQIEMKATNVTLETSVLPELPEPFKKIYTIASETN